MGEVSKTAEIILEKHSPIFSPLFMDANVRKWRAGIVQAMEEYASQQTEELRKEKDYAAEWFGHKLNLAEKEIADLRQQLAEREKPQRDYTKFFTPPHIAKYMVSLLNPKKGDVVLEPSAGKGAIVREIKEHSHSGAVVFAFDINEDFRVYLRNAGADVVVIKDFLDIPVHAKFSGCVANPPFGNGIDLTAHFNRICEHVKEGGKVVMIVPEDFHPPIQCIVHPIENWSQNSDGTTTPIKIIEFLNTKAESSPKQEIEQKPEHMDLRAFDKLHPEMRQYAEGDKMDAREFLLSMYQLRYENDLVTVLQAYTAMYEYVSPLQSRIKELEQELTEKEKECKSHFKSWLTSLDRIKELESRNEELKAEVRDLKATLVLRALKD